MRAIHLVRALALWVTAGLASSALAQEPQAAEGSLRLVVTDTDHLPIGSAQIDLYLPGGSVTLLTDLQGAVVARVPAGNWTVDVTKPGFTGQKLTNVIVAPGTEAVLPVALDGGYQVSELAESTRPKSHTPDLPARGGVAVVAYAEASRWSRAVLKCDGYGTYLQRPIFGGVARFEGVPAGVACRVRVSGGAPPVVAEFTGGADRVQIATP